MKKIKSNQIVSYQSPQELHQDILRSPCTICGGKATHVGTYVPPDWIDILMSDGKERIVSFPICGDCISPDKVKETSTLIESLIISDLSPEETKH